MKQNQVRYIYTEIHQSSDSKWIKPEFPDACPCCGETLIVPDDPQEYYTGPQFACGGKFEFKPQIQSHTDKWWGTCPVRREEARKERGRECDGCGEKRLEGTGFPIALFGWTCQVCEHRHESKGATATAP